MRQFTILWASQAVSTLGSAMTSYALILWVYGEKNTASSMALLSVFTYLPSTMFCFFAGAVADRWDKKRIMLTADFIAALGTAAIFLLYANGRLEVWHLYAVNFFISCMNAFQKPASYVAVSLLAPREQYNRVGGMQALSNAFVTILAPALATAAMGVWRARHCADSRSSYVCHSVFCAPAFYPPAAKPQPGRGSQGGDFSELPQRPAVFEKESGYSKRYSVLYRNQLLRVFDRDRAAARVDPFPHRWK